MLQEDSTVRKLLILGLIISTAACSRQDPTDPPGNLLTDPVAIEANLQSTQPDQPGLPSGAERIEINDPEYAVGSIVIDNSELALYYIESETVAIRYPVGLGTDSQRWTGTEVISRKTWWPSWTPTAAMIERNPGLYGPHANGMAGGPSNPLGARAMYLGNTYYRIHGTPDAGRIGRHASNGCVNMYQSHVIDLYERVGVGTRVHVIS